MVCRREHRDENGGMHRCRYSILIDEMDVGAFSCESYGVRVTEELTGESDEVVHITTSIPRIDELVERLTGGDVSPCALRDVIADWL